MIRTNPNGLTSCEQDVLDLWDAGLPAEKIARQLGLKNCRVKGILSTYVCSDNWEAEARDSTGLLLEAIARHHPEQIGAAA